MRTQHHGWKKWARAKNHEWGGEKNKGRRKTKKNSGHQSQVNSEKFLMGALS